MSRDVEVRLSDRHVVLAVATSDGIEVALSLEPAQAREVGEALVGAADDIDERLAPSAP
jgi:hypothetical protein